MLEIAIIGTRHFPFPVIIPCPIFPPTNGSGFSFKVFLGFFFFFFPLQTALQLGRRGN